MTSSPMSGVESPYDRAAEILAQDALQRALNRLSYRERRVLELRYGLDGEQPRTLDEVGRTFNVTRQIEKYSFKKLHHLPEIKTLREPARSTPSAIANCEPARRGREAPPRSTAHNAKPTTKPPACP